MRYRFILLSLLSIMVMSLAEPLQAQTDSTAADPKDQKIAFLNEQLKEVYAENAKKEAAWNAEKKDLQDKLAAANSSADKRADQANAKIDSLQRKLVSIASNFLYIPYEKYSIEELAIPAFQAVKGSEYYTAHANRLALLENYPADMQYLVGFISEISKEVWGDNPKEGNLFLDARKKKTSEPLSRLKNSDTYKRYSNYNDWESTWLGGKIRIVADALANPSVAAKDKIDKAAKEIATAAENK